MAAAPIRSAARRAAAAERATSSGGHSYGPRYRGMLRSDPQADRGSGMAAKDRAAKAGKAAAAARNNPYLQRIIEDAELRQNLRQAYDSTRHAYGRLSNGKGPTKALL